jgi:hypothetical protein
MSGIPVNRTAMKLRDTVNVMHKSFIGIVNGFSAYSPPESVKIRMDFTPNTVGKFVYHCHLLEHEDKGMMAIIEVVRAPTVAPLLTPAISKPVTTQPISISVLPSVGPMTTISNDSNNYKLTNAEKRTLIICLTVIPCVLALIALLLYWCYKAYNPPSSIGNKPNISVAVASISPSVTYSSHTGAVTQMCDEEGR